MSPAESATANAFDAAFAHLREGRAAEAIAPARRVLDVDPHHLGALTVLALAHAALGEHAQAVPPFERLAQLQPRQWTHWSNLGNSLRALRRYIDAQNAYQHALSLRPQEPALIYNLGLLHAELGENATARSLFTQALTAAPHDDEIRVYLLRALLEAGEEAAARDLLRDIDANYAPPPEAAIALAGCLTQLGHDARARALLVQARHTRQATPGLHAQLALSLERLNDLDGARDCLALAQTHEPQARDTVLARARLAARDRAFATARADFEHVIAHLPNEAMRAPHYFDLGKACDRLGDRNAAFAAWQAGHAAREARRRHDAGELADAEPDLLRILRDRLTPEDVSRWPAPDAEAAARAPVFVVGFPRSGTTLLEHMLDAHPGLRSMDERPFLQYAISRCFAQGVDYPFALDRLDAAQAADLRARYFAQVAEVTTLAADQRLVDKNPLNMARLPAIARLWPGARVILALRHPCDAVLSCFMQDFRNPGIARLFVSLDSAARTYAALFDYFEAQAPLLPLQVLRLRYEDLVAAPIEQAQRVCEFLGLPWHEAMRDPAGNARRRGYISTPSYEQVVEPIHARAVGRWQGYRQHFASALPVLAPWLDRYAYCA